MFWIHASFAFTLSEGHVQVVRENKKAKAVVRLLSLLLSSTSNLHLALCYPIIVLLDGVQRGMTGENRPIQTP